MTTPSLITRLARKLVAFFQETTQYLKNYFKSSQKAILAAPKPVIAGDSNSIIIPTAEELQLLKKDMEGLLPSQPIQQPNIEYATDEKSKQATIKDIEDLSLRKTTDQVNDKPVVSPPLEVISSSEQEQSTLKDLQNSPPWESSQRIHVNSVAAWSILVTALENFLAANRKHSLPQVKANNNNITVASDINRPMPSMANPSVDFWSRGLQTAKTNGLMNNKHETPIHNRQSITCR